MINIFWKKVCDNKGVTPLFEHKECREQIAELERKIANAEECVVELKSSQQQVANSLGSSNFVCLRTKSNIEKHQTDAAQYEEEKQILVEKLNSMKLDFGEQ